MEYKNYNIRIEQDESPDSPRNWDNLGTMYFLHSRYSLGDKHNFSASEINQIGNDPDYIALPVYMYDHSGITISTSPFSCPWDSGQLGIIAVSKEKVRKEYTWKVFNKNRIETIKNYLKSEVDTYDQYLRGEVFGFIIEKDGENIDSCWGFYGHDYCEQEAKSIVDYTIREELKKRMNKLKTYIKNRVPTLSRSF